MSEKNAAALTYVHFVLDELKLSPTGLARAAGLAPTTLTRPLNDPHHRFGFSMTTLNKIAAFSGISFAPFFEATDFVGMSMAPMESPTMYDAARWGEPPSEESMSGLAICIGVSRVGVFRSPELATIEDHGFLPLQLPNVKPTEAFCIQIGDLSANIYIPEGFYALCVRSRSAGSIGHGDLVVVERRINNGQLMELSVRRLLVPEDGRPILRLDSDAAEFTEVIELPRNFLGSHEPKIVGVVLYAVGGVGDPELREEARQRALARRKAQTAAD